MNTIEIKTDKSGDELQVLIWEFEAFCEIKGLPQPVLKQCNVSSSVPRYKEDWNPDWKGDPDDPQRWKGW